MIACDTATRKMADIAKEATADVSKSESHQTNEDATAASDRQDASAIQLDDAASTSNDRLTMSSSLSGGDDIVTSETSSRKLFELLVPSAASFAGVVAKHNSRPLAVPSGDISSTASCVKSVWSGLEWSVLYCFPVDLLIERIYYVSQSLV